MVTELRGYLLIVALFALACGGLLSPPRRLNVGVGLFFDGFNRNS